MLRQFLIRLGGHDPLSLRDESREAVAPIVMAGAAVFLAACITSLNWAIAGHSLASGSENVPASTAIVGGLLGFLLVSIIDRAGIYQMDTQAGRPFCKAALLIVRLLVVLLVSAVTTGAIAPRLLEPELMAHALQLQERADTERTRMLSERYSLGGLQSSVMQVDSATDSARSAIAIIPPDIRAREERGKACWGDHAHRKARLLQRGYDDGQARHMLAVQAARCSADVNGARLDLDAYGEKSRKALADAEQRQANAHDELNQAKAKINKRLVDANAIEQEAITPRSATVLSSLLASDPGAWNKWYGIWAFITCLELLPLVLKMLSDRSIPGVRISADREIAVAVHERRREAAREDLVREITLRATMDAAMTDALESSEVRQEAVRLFQSKLFALIPIEAAKRIAADIEVAAREIHDVTRRHPDYAHVISEAWLQAMNEVVARLRGGAEPKSA